MPHLLVAVSHHPLEQLAEADRDPDSAGAVQDIAEGRVETGGAGQVVSLAAEDQFARLPEALVSGVGQHRHEQPHELPPVAQGRPRQVLQPLRELRLGRPALGIGHDRHRPE